MTIKGKLLIILTFFLGLVAGMLIDGLVSGKLAIYERYFRDPEKAALLKELDERLSLTSEQKQSLNEILEDGRRKILELRKTVRPQFAKIRNETRQKIREILTGQQRDRLEQLLKEFDQERERRAKTGI